MVVVKSSDAYLTCVVHNKQQDRNVEWIGMVDDPLGIVPAIPISVGAESKDPYKYQMDVPSALAWRLKVQNIQTSDEMRFRCQVLIGNQKYAFDERVIRVTTAPQIDDLRTSSDISVTVGDPVELRCNATGRPFPIVKWEKLAGGLLPTGGREHRDYVLDLGTARPEHRGQYKCTAENEQGKAQRLVSLTVKFAPVGQPFERTPEQAIGYKKDLLCVFEAYPIPTKEQVQWYKNGNVITTGGNFETTYIEGASDRITMRLTINRVQQENYGYYECLASNSEGSGKTNIELKPSSVPTPDLTGRISGAGMLTFSLTTVLMLLGVCFLHFL
ncbi:hypothetical protein FSP39_014724 [Pinctada imbricata]|uniref:Ig-like domain-containing protein n=1 Tax=Pinctada imbricata TaxID=66713 RepID=A0AA88XDD7_PINIB|nr:hypothetical protein FSP39_014724 [Pinctada imbricata]